MTSVINDITLLYELSLSIGQSMNAKQNCEKFISTLLSRKGYNFGVVWVNNSLLSNKEKRQSSYKVIYSANTTAVKYTHSISSQNLPLHLETENFMLLNDEQMQSLNIPLVSKGINVVIKLSDVGYIFLHGTTKTIFDEIEYRKLKKVFHSFGLSLAGNLYQEAALYEAYERARTESKLREKEKLYESVVKNMSEGLIITDMDDKIDFSNKMIQEFTGYDISDLFGSKVYELFDLDKTRQLRRLKDRTRGLKEQYEIKIRRKDGSYFWAMIKAAPYKNADGEVIGSMATIDDITPQIEYQKKIKSIAAFPDENPHPVFRTDMNFRILYTNQGCNQINFPALLDKNMAPPLFTQHITTKDTGEFEVIIGKRVFHFTYRNIRNEYYNFYGNDISEERFSKARLEHSEEKYRSILENMELGLLEVDNNNIIIKPYKMFCKMLGYEPHELVGRNAIQVFSPDKSSAEKVKSETEHRLMGKTGVYEMKLCNKLGQEMWMLTSGAPIYNDREEVIGSIGIHYDISDRKAMEEKLVSSMQKEQISSRAKELFLANMSHEIRTPMNAIIGMSGLMTKTDLTSKQKEYLDAIKNSGEGLLAIINDILDVSKIEEGKLELVPEDFDLLEFANSLVKLMLYKADEKGISLNHNFLGLENLIIFADKSRIKQVLINLLNNALKFTDKGFVSLNIQSIIINQNAHITFDIQDTGLGIHKDKISTIFNRFEQANSSISKFYGGTGLGLTIVNKLVQLFNSEMKVESTFGKGSSFSFEIIVPLGDKRNLLSENDEIINLENATNLKILMAEDNEYNQMLARDIFHDNGMNITIVDNGKMAVHEIENNEYDIVLMDVRMPVMDGMEATFYIRNVLNSDIPILALTANAIKDDKEKYLKQGMTDYLSKPYNTNDLFRKIAELTQSKIITKTQDSNNKNYLDLMPKALYSLENLKNIFGKNENAIHKMINKFVNYIPQIQESWAIAYNENDANNVAEIAHKLLGSVRTFKLENVCPQLKKIETTCDHEKQLDNVHKLYHHCQAQLTKAIDQIKTDFEIDSSQPSE